LVFVVFVFNFLEQIYTMNYKSESYESEI